MNSGNISNEQKLKQTKSKVDFNNIKSIFIIKKIINKTKKYRFLKIIKYNKQIQKRLDININNYKEFYCSPIEIELTLVNNKYTSFINIPKKDEKYYHIYFDDSNVEVNRTFLNKNENVKTIKIIIDYQVLSFQNLFENRRYIYSIFFKKCNRINITDMHRMFFGCKSLEILNLSNLKTNNVTDMSYMFYECSSLKELNLSSFKTNNVINMSHMFYGCESLKELDLSSFKINNVTDISYMFHGCVSLKELNFSSFKINNILSNKNLSLKNCLKKIKKMQNENIKI